MTQLNFHNQTTKNNLEIINKLSDGYKTWHNFLDHLSKPTRYTLGNKIDNLFTECLELALLINYSPRDEKYPIVKKLSVKFDALKFFLKTLWEIKGLENKKYIFLSNSLDEVGKMIGSLIKSF